MFICDVFNILIGYVLGQLNEENKEYVVVYGGKFFFLDQCKFIIIEKECLVVISGIEVYRLYLVYNKFIVVIDYKVLVWLQIVKYIGRLERWALKL